MPRDGVRVLKSRDSGVFRILTQPFSKLARRGVRGEIAFLDPEPGVGAGAGGFIERQFFNEKIAGLGFDGDARARGR